MKKRIICLLLCAVTLLPSLTAPVSAAPADETAQTPASEAANYLQQGDYFVISRPSWISPSPVSMRK